MIFHQVDAGGDRNFAYLMADQPGGMAALIDPPPRADRYRALIEDDGLTVQYVIITHGHGDHTWGVAEAKRRYKCRVVAHKSMMLDIDKPVDDGDSVPLGSLELRVIYTPGHSDDHICILCENKLITGDTLFVGKVGGTDLGAGARREYDSLHNKLMKLPPDTEVWPGHNFGTSPSSTIAAERDSNPFLLQKSFDDFVDLKMNWIEYKKAHGIK